MIPKAPTPTSGISEVFFVGYLYNIKVFTDMWDVLHDGGHIAIVEL
jgi:hypothetical protein